MPPCVFIIFGCVAYASASSPGGTFITTRIGPKPIWNSTHTDKLKHDLLLNYDKFARPAQHFDMTTVKIALTLLHIELNEFKSTMTVHAWVTLSWEDQKLKWNRNDYGGIKELHLADHEIWQPDILLYNSAAGSVVNSYGSTHCIAKNDGQIIWVPPAQFTVLCEINLRYWPFDVQNCYMRFGSWTHNGNEIDLEPQHFIPDESIGLELLIEQSEWDIIGKTVSRDTKIYACCPEPYVDVTFNLTLARRSPSYKAVIITPTFVIIVMTLLTFCLPPDAGEKVALNGCISIIISIFMLYLTQKLPAMGSHTPLIVLFYCSSLYTSCFSMLISVIVIWISRTQHVKSLPWIIKQPLSGKMGQWLGLGSYISQSVVSLHRVTAEEMRDHHVIDFDDNHTGDEQQFIVSPKISNQQDWVLLAAAIDRISLIVYSVLFVILATSIAGLQQNKETE